MKTDKTYTVSQMSKLTGVSVRALHHYDDIGLLKPKRRSDNGYREYSTQHLAQLQQILIYRELDFRLEDIIQILESSKENQLHALQQQKEVLLKRREEAQSMINSIEATMTNLKGKTNIELFFKDFPQEKSQRWLDTINSSLEKEQLNEAYSRLGRISEEDALFEKQAGDEWTKRYVSILSQPVDSPAVQNLIHDYYVLLNRLLKRMNSKEEFQGIGYNGWLLFADKAINDEVSYEALQYYAEGLAEHLHEAMIYFAEHTLKDNLEEYRAMGDPS